MHGLSGDDGERSTPSLAGTGVFVPAAEDSTTTAHAGDDGALARLLAPAPDRGWLHCGPPGSGHFVKMVHNGIEYGIMAAYAEGLNILRHADVGLHQQEADAETTPLRDPKYYQYDIDTTAVSEVWRRGSVVASWLLDLTATALARDPSLAAFAGINLALTLGWLGVVALIYREHARRSAVALNS